MDNHVINNEATNHGGGMRIGPVAVTLTGNLIDGNTAGADGGGVAITGGEGVGSPVPLFLHNTITHNVSPPNTGAGIQFRQTQLAKATIKHCTINDNDGDGVHCDDGSRPTLTYCYIMNNSGNGVTSRLGSEPNLRHCAIESNQGFAAQCEDGASPITALDCWWGDATGPYHPTANPNGLGGEVGDCVMFEPWSTIVGVTSESAPPATVLQSVFPNPFNPRTNISYTLDRAARIEVGVYDLGGGLVSVLTDRTYEPGRHSVVWNGRNAQGRAMPSGTYIVRVETEERVQARKVMLVR